MKELHLQDLLNMADTSAHDSICDLWNQKTVHFLVIFTSADQDFEVIGAGPALPYKTMEEAAAHTMPGKKAEFYIKCPAAIAGRLQPRLAPGIVRPAASGPNTIAPIPSVKGRTASPFARPVLTPKAESPEAGKTGDAAKPEAPAPAEPLKPKSEPPPAAAGVEKTTELDVRERAIARREHELAALSASLKIREASLRDREAAVAESEERLLNQSRKSV